MVKIAATYNTDGYITAYTKRINDGDTVEEVEESVLRRLILGLSKLAATGSLLYRCSVSTDGNGYIEAAGTDPAGTTDLYADELATLVPGATKLNDGHLVVDAAKVAEIEAELATPAPTAQDTINAELLKATAQSQLANATLLKQMATMQEVVNNG